jgi:hypothetical protein
LERILGGEYSEELDGLPCRCSAKLEAADGGLFRSKRRTGAWFSMSGEPAADALEAM